MKRLLLITLCLLGFLVHADDVAEASILIPKDLHQLAREADQIVIGRVTTMKSDWLGKTKLIYTHTTIAVDKIVKGKAMKTVVVSEIGGRVGTRRLSVAGVPQYRVGERVLVFMKKDALGLMRTHGATQGKFRLLRDRGADETLAISDGGHRDVILPFFHKDDISPRGAVELEDFEAKVRELTRRRLPRRKTTDRTARPRDGHEHARRRDDKHEKSTNDDGKERR